MCWGRVLTGHSPSPGAGSAGVSPPWDTGPCGPHRTGSEARRVWLLLPHSNKPKPRPCKLHRQRLRPHCPRPPGVFSEKCCVPHSLQQTACTCRSKMSHTPCPLGAPSAWGHVCPAPCYHPRTPVGAAPPRDAALAPACVRTQHPPAHAHTHPTQGPATGEPP